MTGLSLKPSSQSYNYIRESGDFVVAVCSEMMVRDVHFCGVNSGKDMEKSRYMALPMKWGTQATPMILPAALANLECRVRDITTTGDRPWIVGEVMAVLVDSDYYENGWNKDTPLLHYIGGNQYRCGEVTYNMSDIRPGLVAEY